MGKHSLRTALKADLDKMAKKAGGSHLTIESRKYFSHTFSAYIIKKGYVICSVHQIKPKHVTNYLEHCRSSGYTARTIQNHITHLRTILREAGREQFVREQLSSEKLGLEKSCRDGTKYAMSDRKYEDAVAVATARDKGVAAGLMLCRELGLRGQEAVMSGRHLNSWQAALEGRSSLPVIISSGTKGGRIRELPVSLIPDKQAALEAVKFAQTVTAERGGNLIDKPTLEQAVNRWDNETRAIGLKGENSPHALRYAFAVEAIQGFQAKGLTEKQAYALTSCLLGHGEGRGRWVRQVYSRTAPEEAETALE